MYENTKSRSFIIFQAVVVSVCVLLAAICIFPLLNVVATSLSSPEMITKGQVFLWPKEFNIFAYGKVMASGSFIRSLKYTIFLTISFTVLSMFMTILCAYPLSRKYLKGRKLIMVFILFTMYFDAGIIPNYLVIKDLKLLNTTWSLILPGILSAYNMIILRNFFSAIDSSILESAQMDGCSEFGLLFRIVLPLSGAVIATLSLFYAVSRWNAVTDSIFYITDPNKYPLQAVLKEIIKSDQASQLDAGQSAALSKTVGDSVKAASVFLSTVPILIVYPFAQKYFTKGIMLGSVKG